MKKLVFLISTQGKTAKQIAKEAWTAFQKHQKVEKQVLKKLKNEKG